MKGSFVIGPGVNDAGGEDTDSGGGGKRWEFHTKNRIGHGSFGSIYLGEWRSRAGCSGAASNAARPVPQPVGGEISQSSLCSPGRDLDTGEKVAVKVEAAHSSHPQLAYEAKVYRLFEKSSGFPRVHFSGKENGRAVMVMDLCGPSLEELFVKCGRRLALPTVLVLAEQLLRRLETVHSRGFVHRDIVRMPSSVSWL
jgi:serine/threonine protein kinase